MDAIKPKRNEELSIGTSEEHSTGIDTHVIRNAGGRASNDAIRSLVIGYKLFGTCEWFVIHHTDCGIQLFSDEVMSGLLELSHETANIIAQGWLDHERGPGNPDLWPYLRSRNWSP